MQKSLIAIAAFAATSLAHAFVPQGGTWIISDELNGKPGRGFAMDVQNDTLVMQVYAYEANGQPTFYMATGHVDQETNIVNAQLGRYEGGRSLGSGEKYAYQTGSPGNMRIRFTSGTEGFITLPNEPERAIKRFLFGYDNNANSLLGLWSVVYADQAGKIEHDPVELTRITGGSSYSNGMAVSYDGVFACEKHVRGGDAGKVMCVKMRSSTSSTAVRDFWMLTSVHQGEGDWRHVGSSGDGAVYANRLMTASGKITGILRKATVDASQEQVNNDSALRNALEQAAQERAAP